MTLYYVNTSTGNDSNDGSQANPWLTLLYALSHTTSSDTLSITGNAASTGPGIIAADGSHYDSGIYTTGSGYAATGILDSGGDYQATGILDADASWHSGGIYSESLTTPFYAATGILDGTSTVNSYGILWNDNSTPTYESAGCLDGYGAFGGTYGILYCPEVGVDETATYASEGILYGNDFELAVDGMLDASQNYFATGILDIDAIHNDYGILWNNNNNPTYTSSGIVYNDQGNLMFQTLGILSYNGMTTSYNTAGMVDGTGGFFSTGIMDVNSTHYDYGIIYNDGNNAPLMASAGILDSQNAWWATGVCDATQVRYASGIFDGNYGMYKATGVWDGSAINDYGILWNDNATPTYAATGIVDAAYARYASGVWDGNAVNNYGILYDNNATPTYSANGVVDINGVLYSSGILDGNGVHYDGGILATYQLTRYASGVVYESGGSFVRESAGMLDAEGTFNGGGMLDMQNVYHATGTLDSTLTHHPYGIIYDASSTPTYAATGIMYSLGGGNTDYGSAGILTPDQTIKGAGILDGSSSYWEEGIIDENDTYQTSGIWDGDSYSADGVWTGSTYYALTTIPAKADVKTGVPVLGETGELIPVNARRTIQR